MKRRAALIGLALIAGCGQSAPDDRDGIGGAIALSSATAAPFSDKEAGPDAARDRVRLYYRIIAQKQYDAAQMLWAPGPIRSEASSLFASRFAGEENVRADVGRPSAVEAAADAVYVTVPVAVRGQPASAMDRPYLLHRLVVLKRVEGAPGASADLRRWHIAEVRDVAAGPEGLPNPIAF